MAMPVDPFAISRIFGGLAQTQAGIEERKTVREERKLTKEQEAQRRQLIGQIGAQVLKIKQ